MSFVLVQHLDPNHKSLLVELLAKHTQMPIAEVRDGTRIQADRIYVIPPNATLSIRSGLLRLSKPTLVRGQRRPIDTFFSSLAEDQGERAICIVLSGTGSDGSLGLAKIKEHGGLCLAQAEFDSTAMPGMPQSAAATGRVDHIVEVQDMPSFLIDYQQHLQKVSEKKREDGTREDIEPQLAEIIRLLRLSTGHDFSRYKRGTVLRRIQRRMQVLRIDGVTEFIARLKREPQQIDLLFREFLIGVTQFFRDPKTFKVLEQSVLPQILQQPDEPLRIWVPACATGEEVYSIAILVKEAMKLDGTAQTVQIFGTDIDDVAVAMARAGRFPMKLDGISPERAERWFVSDGHHLCPVREIREMCVFSTHSAIKDPPFSRLHLISCRNLLIYLEPDLQDRLMRTFHYALRPGGYLCLGQSEGVTRTTDLFTAVDTKHRIFQRRESYRTIPEYPMNAVTAEGTTRRQRASASAVNLLDGDVHRAIGRHLPAYVVIDQHEHVLRFSNGPIARFLEPSPGPASLKLLDLVRKPLRPAVRMALRQAKKSTRAVVTELPAVALDHGRHSIKLIVEPIADVRDENVARWVVAFVETAYARRTSTGGRRKQAPEIQTLEHELEAVKVQLSATIEELEILNEENKSAKEEYQSVNEELQSLNEELETAKEEMQSVNEELQTINAELSNKNELLVRVNDDLKNLLDSTEIATMFLHDDLRIKNFTPAMTELFHLREGDRGRPITDLMSRMVYKELDRDVKEVLRTLQVVEREVTLTDGERLFLMRIRPYRSVTNVIDGVVITFVDISEREHHRLVRARLAAIVESSQDGIIGHQFDGTITSWNVGAETIFGYPAAEAIGQPFSLLMPGGASEEVTKILRKVQRGHPVKHFEIGGVRKDGKRIDMSLSVSPVHDARGQVIAASTIAREVTERKLAEEHRETLMGELDHRVKNTLMVISSLISQTLRTTDSPVDFAKVIEGRIQSLGRVHNLLNRNSHKHAELHAIVSGELAAYGGGRQEAIRIEGSEHICLTGRATQAIALALHELSTNASKFGALSTLSGFVCVKWRVERSNGTARLSIEWQELGGPAVTAPSRHGFGSHLIERVVKAELDADVQRDFLEEGVRCLIAFDLNPQTGYVLKPATRIQ